MCVVSNSKHVEVQTLPLILPCGGVNSGLFSEQSLNPPLIFLFYGGRIVLYIDLCGVLNRTGPQRLIYSNIWSRGSDTT